MRPCIRWVPKDFGEPDIKPLFDAVAPVADIICLKDKRTGLNRGCAFVSYALKSEAEAAIAKLDRKIHLTGALCPLEVGSKAYVILFSCSFNASLASMRRFVLRGVTSLCRQARDLQTIGHCSSVEPHLWPLSSI